MVDESAAPPGSTPGETEVAVEVADFASTGDVINHVTVELSYGIIERFSEGLYSSPNKTFEELVSNSYDAGANNVWVYLPADLDASGAAISVIDDGTSMDEAGLQQLWRIGESPKRTGKNIGPREPIGKFGIGKLATYVLAQEFTYITFRDGRYLAVTMDFSKLTADNAEVFNSTDMKLDVVELSKDDAIDAVARSLASARQDSAGILATLADDEPDHWTAAVLTRLKSKARQIQKGRLRWILETALPLNPSFALHYNDEELESSKASKPPVWQFVVGKDEDQLPTGSDQKPWHKAATTQVQDEDGGEHPALVLPEAGVVWGTAIISPKDLSKGKSQQHGRSHGYFVRVRRRLINIDVADFSVGPELHHGTLTRFHMDVNADGLDDQVASTRENLKESAALSELKAYLLAVFNRARSVLLEQDADDHMPLIKKDGRLSDPPPALSEGPLRRMLLRVVDGDGFVQGSLGVRDDDLPVIAEAVEGGGDIVEKVVVRELGDDNRFVTYKVQDRSVVLNQSHPFVANYIQGKNTSEALRLLGLTELLTEAYMLDENVSPNTVARVFRRRDAFLRALTHRYPRAAHVTAQNLRDSSNDEKALEDAVGDALELLGFSVLRLGGPSHGTDGIATARLGWRKQPRSDSYGFTYEAKSSGKRAVEAILDPGEDPDTGDAEQAPQKRARIRADTARTSILRVHREKAQAEHGLDVAPAFTLLVAPGFQGEDTDDGLINDVCRNDGITAITVEDLARVVEMFPLQGLNPHDLRSLFDARTPAETADWVEERAESTRVPKPPVSVLVDVLVKYSEGRQPIDISALGAYLRTEDHDLSEDEVGALVRGLKALAPKSVYVDETIVGLNVAPPALYREMRETLNHFDPDLVGGFVAAMPDSTEKDS